MSLSYATISTTDFRQTYRTIVNVALSAGWTLEVDRLTDTYPAVILHSSGEDGTKDIWAQILLKESSYRYVQFTTMGKWVAPTATFDLTGNTSLSYTATTITKSASGAGFDTFFSVGDLVTIWGSGVGTVNGASRRITGVTATTLTFPTGTFYTSTQTEPAATLSKVVMMKGGGAIAPASLSEASFYFLVCGNSGVLYPHNGFVISSKDHIFAHINSQYQRTDVMVGTYYGFYNPQNATTTVDATVGATTLQVASVPSHFIAGKAYFVISSAGYEKVTVSAINGTTLTVSALTKAHPTGATIGEDPVTNFVLFYNPSGTVLAINTCTAFNTTPAIDYGYSLASGKTALLGSADATTLSCGYDNRYNRLAPFPAYLYHSDSKELLGQMPYFYKVGLNGVDFLDIFSQGNVTYRSFMGGTYIMPCAGV